MEYFNERILPFIKLHFVALIIGGLGIVFLVYGLISYYYVASPPEEIAFTDAEDDPANTPKKDTVEKEKLILVDIAGAVTKPGVYSLPSGSRVQDVLIAAGGVSQDADQSRIAQTLNLAAPLADGAKLYIPAVGDQIAAASTGVGASSSSTSFASESPININAATAEELDTLSGVGEVTAEKIIANRPYEAVEDLLEKKVVGAATYEKIKEKISVF